MVGAVVLAMSETEQLTAALRELDTHGVGSIACNEMRQLFSIMDPNKWPGARVDALLRASGASNDGYIAYESFIAWLFDGSLPSVGAAADAPADHCFGNMCDEELLTTLQKRLSVGGPSLSDSLLMKAPIAHATTEEALLQDALDEGIATEVPTRGPSKDVTEEQCLDSMPEEQLFSTLQRCLSGGGPSLSDSLLLQAPADAHPASEEALLQGTLEQDAGTEAATVAPTRQPSRGSIAEPPIADEGSTTEDALMSTLQRCLTAGPLLTESRLVTDPSSVPTATEEALLNDALAEDAATVAPTRQPSRESLLDVDGSLEDMNEEELRTTLQRGLASGGMSLSDSLRLRAPVSSHAATEEALLQDALEEDAGASATMEDGTGASSLTNSLLQKASSSAHGATEEALLRGTLLEEEPVPDEVATDPPTRQQSLEPAGEPADDESVDLPETEEEIAASIQFSRSRGLSTLDTPLLQLPEDEPVSEEIVFRNVLEDSITRWPSLETLPEETSADLAAMVA